MLGCFEAAIYSYLFIICIWLYTRHLCMHFFLYSSIGLFFLFLVTVKLQRRTRKENNRKTNMQHISPPALTACTWMLNAWHSSKASRDKIFWWEVGKYTQYFNLTALQHYVVCQNLIFMVNSMLDSENQNHYEANRWYSVWNVDIQILIMQISNSICPNPNLTLVALAHPIQIFTIVDILT